MSQVASALGTIDSSRLGITLMHEHVFVNLLLENNAAGLLHDYDLMSDELQYFADAGGGTIVELSSSELTRGAAPDPGASVNPGVGDKVSSNSLRSVPNADALQRISRDTGLNIVLGTGHYRDPYLDTPWFDRNSVSEIAGGLVRELTVGIGDTGIRAGIIGEVGANKWYISAAEERSLRAAARAQKATNVAISTHAYRWPVGIQQLDLFEEEQVDLRRVIIGHCDTVNIPEYHEAIARRGAFVQFDTIRGASPRDDALRVRFVVGLIEKGYIEKVLLSQDVCVRTHLRVAGGSGYDHLLVSFVDQMLEAGVSAQQVHQICVDNPRRALTGAE